MWPLLIPMLVLCFGGAVALVPTDPCLEVNHQIINDSRRSSGYEIERTIDGLCDHTLREGWFRFVSHAGGRMPTQCVPQYHCGTRQPLWLDTALPSRADGEVAGRACLNTGRDCCEHYMDIGVKNCGDYFIYYLRPVPSCPIAYCAGDRTPCKDGMKSRDGFEPGCAPVVITTPAATIKATTTPATTTPATTTPATTTPPRPTTATSHSATTTHLPVAARCTTCSGISCLLSPTVTICSSSLQEFCLTTVVSLQANLEINRGCATRAECDSHARANSAECSDIETRVLSSGVTCRYCCFGDNCNHPPQMLPDSGTLYLGP